MGRRGFLKLLAGAGAGITALKSGIFGLGKKTAVKEAVKQTAGSGGQVPPYFFNLVSKIKKMGDDTLATKDKAIAKKYKDYTMEEDFAGNIEIIKKGDNVSEDVFMSLKVDEVPLKGKNKSTKVQEYEEYTATPDAEGKMKNIEQGVPDEVVQEVNYTFDKADGGRIGYAKGKGVMTLLDLVKKKFGRDSITTADKIKTPQKTLDRDMFKKFDNRNPDPKRQMTSDELEDFEMEIGPDQLEGYDFDGTVGDAQRILKEDKAYEAEMYQQYKMGKLDPVAGDKSPARKRFLEQKLADMEASGDSRLMTREEIEELTFFDLGTEMDKTKLSVNDEIKQGVAEIMSDTSPAALQKSIEIDNLMLKYPGMNKNLAEQIATEINPRKKADIIAMVEQTFKMSEKGMSGADIIQTFKNTTRTKQASGGIAHMLGE
jgi:hypothetical protein